VGELQISIYAKLFPLKAQYASRPQKNHLSFKINKREENSTVCHSMFSSIKENKFKDILE
jgi:hypothetical protein